MLISLRVPTFSPFPPSCNDSAGETTAAAPVDEEEEGAEFAKNISAQADSPAVDKDYSDIDIKMDITKAFTYIVEHGDGIDELKEDKNIPFEDSVERIVLEDLTNPEKGYGYDFHEDVD